MVMARKREVGRINVISHVLSRTMDIFGDGRYYTMLFPFSESDGVFKKIRENEF